MSLGGEIFWLRLVGRGRGAFFCLYFPFPFPFPLLLPLFFFSSNACFEFALNVLTRPLKIFFFPSFLFFLLVSLHVDFPLSHEKPTYFLVEKKLGILDIFIFGIGLGGVG